MDYSIKFWDRIAERYARKPVANEDHYRHKLTVTQQYLTSDMTVLEFGCGTGSTALEHAPYVKSYLAIDNAPKMIEIAESKLQAAPLANLQFATATLAQYADQKQHYDAILGLNILHLMPDWEDEIDQVAEMLKPGGLFISNSACLKTPFNPFRLIAPIGSFLHLIPRVAIFSQQQLESAITTRGFSIEYGWAPQDNPTLCFMVGRKT